MISPANCIEVLLVCMILWAGNDILWEILTEEASVAPVQRGSVLTKVPRWLTSYAWATRSCGVTLEYRVFQEVTGKVACRWCIELQEEV
jgi:hypothetical protein